MKAFVYDKRTSETIDVHKNVDAVSYWEDATGKAWIVILTKEPDNCRVPSMFKYDTKKVKTRIYQN